MDADLKRPKNSRTRLLATLCLASFLLPLNGKPLPPTPDKDRDTICIYFEVDSHSLDTSFGRNKEQLARLDSLMRQVAIDSILIVASVSPDGKLRYNEQLAKQRERALSCFIKERLPLCPATKVTSALCHVTWDNVLEKVRQDSLFPRRTAVIRILEDRETGTFQKQQRLKLIGKGIPYRRMAKEWLPQERFAKCIVYLQRKDSCTVDVTGEWKPVLPPPPPLPPLPADTPGTFLPDKPGSRPSRWRAMTNLAYWAALAHNAGIEYAVSDRQTVSLGGACAWWSKLERQRVYRWMAGELVFHHYLRPARSYRHSGFFAGAYLQTGEFELMFGQKNRKGEFSAAGICGGYRQLLGDRFALHAEAGIGYMYIDYLYAASINGKLIRQGHNYAHYVGPTRLSLSIVYNFKSKRR